jgi:hypothetical protein
MVSFECFTSRSGVLSMLQCESLAAAARMLCIEGGGTAGIEGRGKQGSVGEWLGRAPSVRAAGAGVGIAEGTGVQTQRVRLGASAAVINFIHDNPFHYY